jgi:hypothetical protein
MVNIIFRKKIIEAKIIETRRKTIHFGRTFLFYQQPFGLSWLNTIFEPENCD